jgi:hypothetical protein
MKWKILPLTLASLIVNAALPVGDTQGTVKAVRTLTPAAGAHSFEIWFVAAQNDRWGCVQNPGYVRVRENGPSMTSEGFKHIFAIALAAQAAGKVLAVDSNGVDPCNSGVSAYMVD